MKKFFKTHSCKLLFSALQVAFLGGGHVYLQEFKAVRDQIRVSEQRVVTEFKKLQNVGTKVYSSVDGAKKSIESAKKYVKKAEKACKKFL